MKPNEKEHLPGDEEIAVDKFNGPRELGLNAMAEIQGQLKLQLEVQADGSSPKTDYICFSIYGYAGHGHTIIGSASYRHPERPKGRSKLK